MPNNIFYENMEKYIGPWLYVIDYLKAAIFVKMRRRLDFINEWLLIPKSVRKRCRNAQVPGNLYCKI